MSELPRTKVGFRSVPCINVADVAASIAYYRDSLNGTSLSGLIGEFPDALKPAAAM